jgi:KRAB domain-containing zinc finger protein
MRVKMKRNSKAKILKPSKEKETKSEFEFLHQNIKREPSVEFLLILPSASVQVKTEIDHNVFKVQEKKDNENRAAFCYNCQKSFRSKALLTAHNCFHKPKIKCPICSKEIKKPCLWNHLATHKKENDFFCDHCPSGFKMRRHLISHMNIHRKTKLFNCGKCNVGFNTKYHYNQHFIRHSDPKPFKCDLCIKEYSNLCHLKSHILTFHLQIHRVECPICKKIFSNQNGLKSHQLLVHSDRKQHLCKACGKTYMNVSYLNSHIKRMHTEGS